MPAPGVVLLVAVVLIVLAMVYYLVSTILALRSITNSLDQTIASVGEIIEKMGDRILGRVALEDVIDPVTSDVLVKAGGLIDEDLVKKVDEAGIDRVRIRSVLTCQSRKGICGLCYGRDLARGRMVNMGEAVGVIAAQSIGEPGTQLTMRTFHIGGAATGSSEQSKQDARTDGFAKYIDINTVRNAKGELIAMNRSGIFAVVDAKGRERERYQVVYGARVLVEDGAPVKENMDLLEWDPYTFSILTEISGTVHFKDLMEGVTMQEQVDEISGNVQLVVVDSPDEKKMPAIEIIPEGGTRRDAKRYLMPTHAHLMVREGDPVHAGDVLAKIPRATTKTKDITGGLPRVVELFEARKPRETAVISEINGALNDIGYTLPGQNWTYWNKGPGPGDEEWLTTDEKEWSTSTGEACAKNLLRTVRALRP